MSQATTSLPKLIIAASGQDADMLYATGFFVPDPFIFLQQGGRTTIVLSDLEIDRGRKEARVDRIVPYSGISRGLKKGRDASFLEHTVAFLRERKVRCAAVPGSFPLGLAAGLAKAGIRLVPQPGLFWPRREFKTAAELRLMRQALAVTEIGMARGLDVLRAAEIGRKNALRWGGGPLTSEILRAEIDSAILRAGGLPAHTIVAGGEQACDPHEGGHGPLRAHELIILDLFPRTTRTGYFGDLTRTVIRGRASDAQRWLWDTCLAGQKKALRAIRPGEPGKQVQGRHPRLLHRARLPHRTARRPLDGLLPRPRPRAGPGDSRSPARRRHHLPARPGRHRRARDLRARPGRCAARGRGDHYRDRQPAALAVSEGVGGVSLQGCRPLPAH